MRRAMGPGLAMLLALAGTRAEGQAGKDTARAQVVAVRVARASLVRGALKNEETSLKVRVTLPGKTILGLDEGASKVAAFTDDRGTNLARDHRLAADGLALPDASTFLVLLSGKATPAPKATRIQGQCSLVLRCGAGAGKVTAKEARALVKGTKWKVGDFEVEVFSEKASTRGAQFGIANRPLAHLETVTAVDGDGKELKLTSQGTAGPGLGTSLYQADRVVEKATLTIHYFAKVETVTVPVALSVGLGLE